MTSRRWRIRQTDAGAWGVYLTPTIAGGVVVEPLAVWPATRDGWYMALWWANRAVAVNYGRQLTFPQQRPAA